MAAENAAPSINPADVGSLPGTFRAILTKFLQGVDDMLPAQIVEYDRATNRASVQPLIQMVTTRGDLIERAQLASLPVLNIGGGGFILSFPLKPGDLGWIKASDRDISLFLQTLAQVRPNTVRMHSFEDAVFIPDVMREWALSGEDAERAVLQSTDGAVRVAVGADGVYITGATKIVGNVEIDGNVSVSGDVEADGISLTTHRHGGVVAGSAQSGGPV